MSVKMMFAAMNVETGSPITKLVLIKLADNANEQGECWPSHDTIARICEMSVKTSQRHIRRLVDLGILEVKKRKGPQGNASNFYQLNVEKVATNSLQPSNKTATNSPLPSDRESPTSSDRKSPTLATESRPNQSVESVINESIRESLSLTGVITISQLEDFIEHRKSIKRPMTSRAIEMFIKRLNDLAKQGHDVSALVETAIISGWQNVYPDKNSGAKGQGGFQTRKEQISERNMQACQEFIGGSDHE